MVRRTLLAGATVVVSLSIAGTGVAGEDGPYEKNDTVKKAFGPVKNGKNYNAAIERLDNPDTGKSGDTDFYLLKPKRDREITVTYSNNQEALDCFGPEARLLKKNGDVIGSTQPPAGGSGEITHEAKAKKSLFLRVRAYHIESCAPPDLPYRFSVDGLG